MASRYFVLVVYLTFAVAFCLPVAALFWEFGPERGSQLFALYSFRFLVLPATILIGLACFFSPLTVFLDLYWRHVPFGRVRFLAGFSVVVLLSVAAGQWYRNNPGELSIWQVPPHVLAADERVPANCSKEQNACRRSSILQALGDAKEVAAGRLGISRFVRNCSLDPHLEVPDDYARKRRCLANGALLDAPACCAAQAELRSAFVKLEAASTATSLTAVADEVVKPFRAFFLITIVGATLLLVFWHKKLAQQYAGIAQQVDLGIMLTALAMLVAVAAEQAQGVSEGLLFGRAGTNAATAFNMVLVPWTIFVFLYFFRSVYDQIQSTVQQWSRVVGGLASLVGVSALHNDNVSDVFARASGIAASPTDLVLVAAGAAAVAFFMLRRSLSVLRAP